MAPKPIRLPNDNQRIAIVGRTGSGKTIAGLWHLSRKNFDRKPWVILDFKMDESLNNIDRAEHIDITDKAPKRPGIYLVHPLPSQEKEVEDFLWKIWAQENTGVFIDEGYMLGDSPAFRALLTQGRSKRIPMIVLSQRPVWISRFVFSESDFYQVYNLNDKRDRQTINAFLPPSANDRMADYHSRYYDVGRDSLVVFSPVPNEATSLGIIDERLRGRKRLL